MTQPRQATGDARETGVVIPYSEARFIAGHRGEMTEFLAAIEANDRELAVLRAQRDAAIERLERVRKVMLRERGRLTPGGILDVQGALNALRGDPVGGA